MSTWEEEVRKLLQDSERARNALDSALDAEKTVRATCKCGYKFDVPVKDTTNAVRAAEIWFRQGAELAKHLERLHGQIPTNPKDDRPLKDIPTSQLTQLARQHGSTLPGIADQPQPDQPDKPDKPDQPDEQV